MKILVLFASVLLFCGCFSMNNLIEAESLGKNNSSYQFSAEPIFVIDQDDNNGLWGVAEFQFGYGLNKNLDIRVAATTNGTTRIQVKYQLLNTDKSDFAIGLLADNAFLFGRKITPGIQMYYGYNFKNATIMINPTVEWSTSTLFGNANTGDYGPFYSLSTGITSHKNNRFKFGLNMGYSPNRSDLLFLSLGCAYEIRPEK